MQGCRFPRCHHIIDERAGITQRRNPDLEFDARSKITMRHYWVTLAILAALCGRPIVAEEPAKNDKELAQAREHLQKGRYAEALELFDELIKSKVKDPRIPISQSRCYRAEGNWKPATDVLLKASQDFPQSAEVWAELADAQLRQGRFQEAERAVEKALEINEELPFARLVRADLWADTGRLEKADDEYRWFVRYYNRVQPEDAETLMLVARGAAQYARWNGVSQIFDFVVNTLCVDALKADQTYWQAHSISGSLLLEKYNRGQAIPEFRSAVAVNPRSSDVYAEMARAALQDHELDEARQFAKRALDINPQHVVSLNVTADVAFGEGDLEQTLKILEKAQAVNPHDEETLARIAACRLIQDGPPGNEELTEMLAAFSDEPGTDKEPQSRFAKILRRVATFNRHPGRFFTVLGLQLESRRKFALAERFYKMAMDRMPMLAEPQTALGMLYMRIGKVDEAGKILDKAFDLDPYHVRVSNMRKVISVLEGYEAITTDHFVIRVDSNLDKVLGRYMAEYLEQEYGKLTKQFGFEPPARTHFEIYNKAKGLSAHQWFSARMVGLPWIQTIGASTGVIVAMASPTASDQQFNWARVLRHEFVHVITLQQTNFNIPHWFTEALAVRNEGYPRPQSWNEMLVARVPAGEMFTLENINQGFIKPDKPEDWQMAYCQSELYAEYFVEKYGPDSLAQMLNAYRDNLATPAAIKKVCGVDQQEFERGYVEYVKNLVGKLPKPSVEEEQLPLAELEKRFRANPEDPSARAKYALGLFKAGEKKQARKFANSALKKNPADPVAAIVLSQLELLGGNDKLAAEHLRNAFDKNAPNPQIVKSLGVLYLKNENYKEAAGLFEMVREHDADNLEWIKNLSAAYLKMGETDKLKPLLERYTELEFDQPAPRKKLAALYLDDKDYDNALKHAKSALHIDVLDVDIHRMLGEAYAGKQDYGRAIDEFEVALELAPGNAELMYLHADAQFQSGNKPAAEETLKKLLQKHPGHKAGQELLKRL